MFACGATCRNGRNPVLEPAEIVLDVLRIKMVFAAPFARAGSANDDLRPVLPPERNDRAVLVGPQAIRENRAVVIESRR
jgi:hypothetical protein